MVQTAKETSHLQGIDFHVSNTAIIPHYELKLEDNQKAFMSDIIREVIIGPCNGSDINTVRSFLAKEGFDYSHIRIKKSGITFRDSLGSAECIFLSGYYDTRQCYCSFSLHLSRSPSSRELNSSMA